MCKQNQFTNKTTHRQQAKHIVKSMSHIIWHINPQIQFVDICLWNVSHCFQPLWPWSQESGLEKMPLQQIAYIIYGSSSIHLGPWPVTNWFQVTVTLTSVFSSSKVEPRAYMYIIWGRNPKLGVRIYYGIMACRIHFWVSLTCSLYTNMFKIL